MQLYVKNLFLMTAILLFTNSVFAAEGVKVVYPTWFKDSFYDLKVDLQDARDGGKKGIMIFFSMKTCSYCKAIIETTFQQADIVKRLRSNYDVIGLEIFSDSEVVNINGQTFWAKDFAVQEKAKFTPTMIFYDLNGKKQLRLIGYQSPKKFRVVQNFLDSGKYTQMKLSDYMHKRKTTSKDSTKRSTALNFDRRNSSDRPQMVVFESANCTKCQQLRTMLKAPVLQSYTKRISIMYMSDENISSQVTRPDGRKQNGKEWLNQLGLIHSPSMVFFDEKGKEILRIDTDILISEYGKVVSVHDENILDNIRARLQFVLEKGYITLPQFQRWRAQKSRGK